MIYVVITYDTAYFMIIGQSSNAFHVELSMYPEGSFGLDVTSP